MTKVLIIQEASRHLENFEFRECLCLERAFQENGWEPTVYGKGHPSFYNKLDFNSFDFILNLENYGDDWLPDLSSFNKPYKILWSIDAHCRGMSPYEEIFKKGKYDLLLNSTLDYVTKPHHEWFPNSICDHKIKNLNLQKTSKFSFVGNHVNRQSFLDFLSKEYNLKQNIFVIGKSMVKSINETYLHFNKNMSNDLNYRNFETIGCGTALITDHNHMYDALGFVDGENVIFYNDMDSLTEKLNYYLEKKDTLSKIGKSGEKLAKRHTYDKRVQALISNLYEKV